MKKYSYSLFLLLVCLFMSFNINLSAANADFVMENTTLNIKAVDILEKGTVTRDANKFVANKSLDIAANTADKAEDDGQYFIHAGAGDKFVFNVDFGKNKVKSISYKTYGMSNIPTVFTVSANNKLLATCSAEGGVSWEPVNFTICPKSAINLSEEITGQCEITIEIKSSSPEWPANNIGHFIFSTEDANDTGSNAFVMEGDLLKAPAYKIAQYGVIERNNELFDNLGHNVSVNSCEQEEYNGQFFIHSGAGDKFIFDVDFGENKVTWFSYMNYGASPNATVFDIYANDELVGNATAYGGNGWEPQDYELCTYEEIELLKELTGKVKIKIEVTESSPEWPANNIGYFTFFKADTSTTEVPNATTTPVQQTTSAPTVQPTKAKNTSDTKDNGGGISVTTILIVSIAVVIIAIVVVVILFVKKTRSK